MYSYFNATALRHWGIFEKLYTKKFSKYLRETILGLTGFKHIDKSHEPCQNRVPHNDFDLLYQAPVYSRFRKPLMLSSVAYDLVLYALDQIGMII